MFSAKRLAYIIIITITFSGLFFLFNLDHDFLRSQSQNEADFIVPSEKYSASLVGDTDPHFLVIGKPSNESETLIKANVIEALDLIKVEYRLVDQLHSDDFNGNEFLIFVVSDVSKTGELEDLAEYIEVGGQAIFAAGIPSETDWRYLDPVWGILERGTFRTVTDITFHLGYFPYDELSIEDGYPSYSTSLRLDDACEILMSGEEDIPLVWTHPYDLGRATMINGTFMESKLSLGVLVASISNSKEHAIYPILGTKTVFLDAIPPLFDGNDENSFEYYGRSAESFVRDKLWAILVQKASLLDLKLTSSFMAIDNQDFDVQNANQQTFSYISREMIRINGEITLSGNHVDLDELKPDRVDETRSFFENFFPNYNIHAYYPLYGKINTQQIEAIQTIYPSIDIIRILYDGDELTQSSGNYQVNDDQVVFPTTTYGYKAEKTQLYSFLSILTSHGAISHSFDINSLFTVPSSESNWNTLNVSFDKLSASYFEKTPWLNALTISPAAEKLRELDAMSYESLTTSNSITVACSKMTLGQTFMFYSKDKILSATGASYQRISPQYYLIKAQTPQFTLNY